MEPMEVKKFDFKTHYKELERWWKFYNHPSVSLEAMPPNTFIAEEGGELVAFSSLYKTDSTFAVKGWTIANPSITSKRKWKGIEAIFTKFEIIAKEEFKASRIMTWVEPEKLAAGFVDLETGYRALELKQTLVTKRI